MSSGPEIKASVDREVGELLNAPWDAPFKPRPEHPYIRELRALTEKARLEDEERAAKAQAAKRSRERAPLEERLKRLIAQKYTPEEQREGLSLPVLQAQLKGRQREHASASELGGCLRRLGFRRYRLWTGGGGFRAVWRKES